MSQLTTVRSTLEQVQHCELWCETHDRQRDGGYRLFEEASRALMVSGEYTVGEKSGTWTTYGIHSVTLESIVVSEEHFRAGQRHGTAKRWHDDGSLAAEGHWIAGARDGEWTTYGPDGQWLARGRFDKGSPIGVHEERYLNGQLTSRRTYDDQGRPVGEWCFWLADGTEVSCQTLVDGTGRLVEYDRKGEVSRIQELRWGRLHGTLTEFTFSTRYEAHYVDGKQHGTTTVYSLDDDCVEKQSTWVNDQLEGPHREFDCSTGAMTVSGQYCSDQMCGRWELRDGSGRLVEVNEYTDDGELLGRIVYGEDGQIDKF